MNVSVIIPTLNEEEYIGACLTGLLNQTMPPSEIIVIDGNSKDRTVEIAYSYTNKIFTTDIKGIGSARAIGVYNARGDVILSTDADTVLEEHFIERGLELLADETVVGVTGKIKAIDPSESHYEVLSSIFKKGRGLNTMFKRRACSTSYCYTTPGLREDWDLWDMLSKRGKVIYDKNLIAYTQLPSAFQESFVSTVAVTGVVVGGLYLLYLTEHA